MEENKEETSESNSSSISEHRRKNDWKTFSFILGIVIIVLVIIMFSGKITGNAISSDEAGKKLVEFAKSRGTDAKVVSVSEKNGMYEIVVSIQGQEMPLYITKDGEYFTQMLIPTAQDARDNTAPPATKEVPKSDKPKAEAFIFSYCPYGLQFEKALFPVYDLLKNKADFNIVAIGAMHGEYEKIETLRQISIEQLYGKDKLFSYLKEFNINSDLGACRGEETCSSKYLPAIYKKLGIDKAKVDAYMKSNAEKIYNEQGARASQLGIGGSPTFVINDVEVQVDRTPNAIKEAVCNAFKTKPNECSQTLSIASASAGFGASVGSANSDNSAAGCAPA